MTIYSRLLYFSNNSNSYKLESLFYRSPSTLSRTVCSTVLKPVRDSYFALIFTWKTQFNKLNNESRYVHRDLDGVTKRTCQRGPTSTGRSRNKQRTLTPYRVSVIVSRLTEKHDNNHHGMIILCLIENCLFIFFFCQAPTTRSVSK